MTDVLAKLTPAQERDALAAELALDLLDGTDRDAALDRLSEDADFAGAVRLAQETLAGLSQELTPVLAPSRTKVMIDRKLGHARIPELQPEPRGPIALGWLLSGLALIALFAAAAIFLLR